jgi:hypothetical protein
MGWRNFSKTAEKKFLQPTRSGCSFAKMVPPMLELIFFYILQKSIQGYGSHFLCARVTVPCIFSGARQQNFAGAGLLCTLA